MKPGQRIHGIRNTRLRGRRDLVDIRIDSDGRIATIGKKLQYKRGERIFDATGGLTLPGFVDPHVHLDLAYSLELVKPNKSGTLIEAIRHWSSAKKTMTAGSVRDRAIRAIDAEASFGTTHIRTHVDVGSTAGLRLVEGVLAAREARRGVVDIQVVTFPQDGIIQDPSASDRMREAMRMGCDVVGGIAHNERTSDDSKLHIEVMFDIAEEFGAPIDCHIDETDDPYSRCTEYLAAQTIERKFHGRVTASHACALASYDDVHAKKVIDLLATGRVHVVTNPQVNLHLQGRFDRYPKRRGLTRVSELVAAGVNVSAGQDCIRDPFYPLGTGQMLDVAHTLVHADHQSTPKQMEWVIDSITKNGAAAMGDRNYGIRKGAFADVVVLQVDNVLDAIRVRPIPNLVCKSGRMLKA
jgi:cytosine deaminase